MTAMDLLLSICTILGGVAASIQLYKWYAEISIKNSEDRKRVVHKEAKETQFSRNAHSEANKIFDAHVNKVDKEMQEGVPTGTVRKKSLSGARDFGKKWHWSLPFVVRPIAGIIHGTMYSQEESANLFLYLLNIIYAIGAFSTLMFFAVLIIDAIRVGGKDAWGAAAGPIVCIIGVSMVGYARFSRPITCGRRIGLCFLYFVQWALL